MKMRNSIVSLFVAGVVSAGGVLPLFAELPPLTDKESLGYFVILNTNDCQFGLTTQGKILIKMVGKKGETLAQKLTDISVNFLVEETLPNGKVTQRPIAPETLESTQAATDAPKDIVFRGKTTNGIGFEVFFSSDRGGVALGGRLLPSEQPSKNPLRFVARMKIPNAYPNVKDLSDKSVAKAFEQKISEDRLTLIMADNKRTKLSTANAIDAGSTEVNGPGIRALQLELSPYKGKKIEFTATENSTMALSNTEPGPLHHGFAISWSADAAKDPDAKARIAIAVK